MLVKVQYVFPHKDRNSLRSVGSGEGKRECLKECFLIELWRRLSSPKFSVIIFYLKLNLSSCSGTSSKYRGKLCKRFETPLRSLHHSTIEISLPSAEAPAKPSKFNSTDVV
jgi:hypothetical protein